MPMTLTMPKLSPTMEEGTIAKWRVKIGDSFKPGDVLLEITTDKATLEHSAIDGGWMRAHLIQEGQSAIVNQAIAIFSETKDESIDGYVPDGIKPQEPKVVEPIKKEGTVEPSTVQPIRTAATGGLQQPAFAPQPPLEHYEMPFPTGAAPERIVASPLARKLAKEKGLDLSTVKGTGPGHRIVSADLTMAQPSAAASFGHRENPSVSPGTYTEESLSPVRKVIAQRLQESKTFIPHFYITQEVRADALWETREQLKAGGIKITFNDFVIRASALALREHPQVNSGFNTVNGTITRYQTIDIAVAVTIDAGLITPIIRHADFKNLGQLSVEAKDLAVRAREGKLAREEYVGGSFTLSNLGMFGVTQFAAIINPPQAAILAVGGIEEKPVVKNGALAVGKVLTITLSADHRVIDGATGALFIKSLQKYLENPSLLLI